MTDSDVFSDGDSSEAGSLDGFIVPDKPKAKRRRVVEDSEDSSGGEEEEGEDSSDSDSAEADSENSSDSVEEEDEEEELTDIVHKTRDEIINAANATPGWNVINDVVYREDLASHANSLRPTGCYKKILVPELEAVVGEHTRNDELKDTRFLGMQVSTSFRLEKTQMGVIGCLCTQTPRSKGGLRYIFNVTHPSGASFLMGRCCAHKASGTPVDEKMYDKSDGAGLRGLLGLEDTNTLL